MFREMRRSKQQLSEDQCIELLKNEPRGVLAVHGEDGYPYALPLDYIYIDGRLYFHCAKQGHKLDAIAGDDRVSFCVMDEGYRKEGDWALNIKSVIIFGRVSRLDAGDKARDIARRLGLKYFPTPEEAEAELAHAFDRVQILELTIDHMTGKQVHES